MRISTDKWACLIPLVALNARLVTRGSYKTCAQASYQNQNVVWYCVSSVEVLPCLLVHFCDAADHIDQLLPLHTLSPWHSELNSTPRTVNTATLRPQKATKTACGTKFTSLRPLKILFL